MKSMKITKRQLRRIIRETCGDVAPVLEPEQAVAAVVESHEPEKELVVEMEMAARSLDLALESINSAAALCPTCVQEVAAAQPLMEAMVSQAAALKETLEAVETVVTESVDGHSEEDLSGALALAEV